MPIEIPIALDDTKLALALHVSGIDPIGIQNRYSPKRLRELGCENIKEAIRLGKSGKVVYFYERTEELRLRIVAWYDQKRLNEEGGKGEEQDVTPEVVMRIGICLLGQRKAYLDLWKTAPAYFWEPGTAPPKKEIHKQHTAEDGSVVIEEMIVTYPGEVLISADLPEDIRKAMKQ